MDFLLCLQCGSAGLGERSGPERGSAGNRSWARQGPGGRSEEGWGTEWSGEVPELQTMGKAEQKAHGAAAAQD